MSPGSASAPDLPLFSLAATCFAAGGRTILGPLDLDLPPGRVYGVVGPNGSGKTTLIKLLARQQAPSGGDIRLFGRDLAAFGRREFSRTLAYMPQFTPPADLMTVSELVALGRFPWHGALGRLTATDHDRIETALRQTDLLRLSERLVDSLSGGERQRAWLAMMLAQDTRCLLLDEPTSALDIGHQVDMLALIRDLSRARGVSVLIVLHDINMAARFCDDILAFGDGRLVARGAPTGILRPDVLGKIYGLPMGVIAHPAGRSPISFVL